MTVDKAQTGAKSVAMENKSVYYIGNDNKIYKSIIVNGEAQTALVYDKFKDPSAIVAMAKYLYVIDQNTLNVLRTNKTEGTGYDQTPIKVGLGQITHVRTITTFRAGAMELASSMLFAALFVVTFLLY